MPLPAIPVPLVPEAPDVESPDSRGSDAGTTATNSEVTTADSGVHASDLEHEASSLRLEAFRFVRHLRAQRAVDAMTDGQLAVLAVLRVHGSQTLTELAERERVTAPSMNRTINCLAESGYIERVDDEADRRKVNILLTEHGHAVVTETVRRRDAWLTQVLAELTDAERETLAAASKIMGRIAKR